MWTASNRDTSEFNPEKKDLFQKTYDSALDWRGPGVGYFTQISMSSAVGKSGQMWALLLLALSLLSCAGGPVIAQTHVDKKLIPLLPDACKNCTKLNKTYH